MAGWLIVAYHFPLIHGAIFDTYNYHKLKFVYCLFSLCASTNIQIWMFLSSTPVSRIQIHVVFCCSKLMQIKRKMAYIMLKLKIWFIDSLDDVTVIVINRNSLTSKSSYQLKFLSLINFNNQEKPIKNFSVENLTSNCTIKPHSLFTFWRIHAKMSAEENGDGEEAKEQTKTPIALRKK